MISSCVAPIRLSALLLVAAAVVVSGLVAAGSSAATSAGRPRTLFAGSRRIYAFALGAHRITWISRTHRRGRYPGCELYSRTLRPGRTSRSPLPRAGCGATPPHNFAPQVPVLASGAAAWVKGSSCGNNECFWQIATIAAGEKTPRIVGSADVACDYTCEGVAPRPALAGGGNLLVYSAGSGGGPDPNIDHVRRIVGRRTVPFAVPPGDGNIEKLVAGGGAVEAVSRVLRRGDGCGCLDSPVWSPDGSKIAYLDGSFSNQQIDPETPFAALAVMNADGSGRHDLTTKGQVGADSLSWSPAGDRIAYVGGSSGGIVVVKVDGSGSLQLGPGYDPAWSPDGSKIAFVGAGCGNSAATISVMNPDGTNAHPLATLAPGQTCVDPGGMAWSPDGARIAFAVNGMLALMNADGSDAHLLGTGITGNQPDWSPDSSRIVFHEDSGLWEIGAAGSGLHQLTNGPDEHPSWSPDGTTIVFGSGRDDPFATSGETYDRAFPELYVVAPDGTGLRPLSFTTPTAFEQQATFYTASGKSLPSLPGLPVLAGHVAAVGSTSNGTARITLFDASTGAQLAVIPIGRNYGRFVVAGADANWVVFQLEKTISALNVHSKEIVRLAKAASAPLDLSVSGRQVAWAENIGGHGRIRALELPG